MSEAIETLDGKETSEVIGQQPDEQKVPETVMAAAGQPGDAKEGEVFDVAVIEKEYGLPVGTLKDAKDEQSAYEAIKTFTDSTLTAGGFGGGAVEQLGTPPAKGKEVAKTVDTIEALRAELDEVKGFLVKQQEGQRAQLEAELNRRVDSRINKWNSDKYGVAGKRTYKQTKAVKEFKEILLPNHVQGVVNSHMPVDQEVEVYMERLRLHDDETYAPGGKKQSAKDIKPLGTPGGNSGGAGGSKDGSPRNIHEALKNNPN